MKVVYLKRGDTARRITDALSLDGAPIDLTGATVVLVWAPAGAAVPAQDRLPRGRPHPGPSLLRPLRRRRRHPENGPHRMGNHLRRPVRPYRPDPRRHPPAHPPRSRLGPVDTEAGA
jgi:hypothetical protein